MGRLRVQGIEEVAGRKQRLMAMRAWPFPSWQAAES